MGRPTTTKKYQAYLWDVLDKLKEDATQTITFQFKNRVHAKNFQLDFLSFRNACVKEKLDQTYNKYMELEQPPDEKQRFHPTPVLVEGRYPDLNAYKTRMRSDGVLFYVDIFHMDYTEEAKSLQAQIDAMR